MNLYRIDACICGKHMVEEANEGTCLWCGHGRVQVIAEFAYERNARGNAAPSMSRPGPMDARIVSRAPRAVWTEDESITALGRATSFRSTS